MQGWREALGGVHGRQAAAGPACAACGALVLRIGDRHARLRLPRRAVLRQCAAPQAGRGRRAAGLPHAACALAGGPVRRGGRRRGGHIPERGSGRRRRRPQVPRQPGPAARRGRGAHRRLSYCLATCGLLRGPAPRALHGRPWLSRTRSGRPRAGAGGGARPGRGLGARGAPAGRPAGRRGRRRGGAAARRGGRRRARARLGPAAAGRGGGRARRAAAARGAPALRLGHAQVGARRGPAPPPRRPNRRERARRAQVRAGGRARAQGAGGAAGRGRAGRLPLRGGARALGAGGPPPGARAGQARQAAGAPRAFC